MEKPTIALEFEKPVRELERQLRELQKTSQENKVDLSTEIKAIEGLLAQTKKEIFENLSPWQRIQLARHPARPYAPDYIAAIFRDFQELHGDRCYGDDQALTGGIGFFQGRAMMILSQQKGRDTKENIKRNFGMPNPEGYRKALRLMKMADKFHLPIVTFVDTPGAYPGLGSEERHVAEAIAVNLREMSLLNVPVISFILGEGGSGGALGIGVANRMLPLENAYYSVISPEGCAAILWKDRAAAPKAAEALKISAADLLRSGIADEVIKEPFGGAHNNPAEAIGHVRDALTRHLEQLRGKNQRQIRDERYAKFRAIGVYEETLVRPAEPAARKPAPKAAKTATSLPKAASKAAPAAKTPGKKATA